jgi:hypothetical protein
MDIFPLVRSRRQKCCRLPFVVIKHVYLLLSIISPTNFQALPHRRHTSEFRSRSTRTRGKLQNRTSRERNLVVAHGYEGKLGAKAVASARTTAVHISEAVVYVKRTTTCDWHSAMLCSGMVEF